MHKLLQDGENDEKKVEDTSSTSIKTQCDSKPMSTNKDEAVGDTHLQEKNPEAGK